MRSKVYYVWPESWAVYRDYMNSLQVLHQAWILHRNTKLQAETQKRYISWQSECDIRMGREHYLRRTYAPSADG
jgi:hypothetical protein